MVSGRQTTERENTMNGQELAGMLEGMTVEQLRKVWKAAALKLRDEGKRTATDVLRAITYKATPAQLTFEILWALHNDSAKRFKTGRKIFVSATTSGGWPRMEEEEGADFAPAEAAVARVLSAAK
jgi:hypothetical protein